MSSGLYGLCKYTYEKEMLKVRFQMNHSLLLTVTLRKKRLVEHLRS